MGTAGGSRLGESLGADVAASASGQDDEQRRETSRQRRHTPARDLADALGLQRTSAVSTTMAPTGWSVRQETGRRLEPAVPVAERQTPVAARNFGARRRSRPRGDRWCWCRVRTGPPDALEAVPDLEQHGPAGRTAGVLSVLVHNASHDVADQFIGDRIHRVDRQGGRELGGQLPRVGPHRQGRSGFAASASRRRRVTRSGRAAGSKTAHTTLPPSE